jgi:hypothetical protein
MITTTQPTPVRRLVAAGIKRGAGPLVVEQPKLSADISALVRRIARWMLHEDPRGTVTDITLEDQARHVSWTHLHHAAGRGRVNPIACDTLTETVFAAMPKPRSGDTRSRYARRILDADAGLRRPAMTS